MIDYCDIPVGLKRGDKGPGVRTLQEWMCLHGKGITVDGDFGPATETALLAGWNARTVTDSVRGSLVFPMSAALSEAAGIIERGGDLAAVAACFTDAREVGPNAGPWVRLFAAGKEGAAYLWCGYFVRFCLDLMQHPRAKIVSPSCDTTAANASKARLFVPTPQRGDLFLKWRLANGRRDYYHIGIVSSANADIIGTVEGNTNRDGSANGDRVAERTRGLANTVFVRLTPPVRPTE